MQITSNATICSRRLPKSIGTVTLLLPIYIMYSHVISRTTNDEFASIHRSSGSNITITGSNTTQNAISI